MFASLFPPSKCARMQWVQHSTSAMHSVPFTTALMLHKVKHTRMVGCGDGGGVATSSPCLQEQLTQDQILCKASWL